MFRMLEGDDAANALRAIARALEDVDEPDAGETLRAIAEALEDAESAQTCSPATYTVRPRPQKTARLPGD
jgi:hypothetical protein